MFALLAIVTAVQGSFVFGSLAAIEGGAAAVAAEIPALSAIHDIEHAVERLRNKQYRLTLASADPEVVANNLVEVDDIRAELAEARSRYERLIGSARERALYEEFASSFATSERLTQPLGQLMRAGDTAAAQQLMLSPWLRVVSKTCEGKLARAVALNLASVKSASAGSIAVAAKAEAGAFLAVSSAALLALLAMLISYVRVIRPLCAITAAMRQLATGTIGPAMPSSRRRDEIGDLLGAVSAFRASLIRAQEAEAARRRASMLLEKIARTAPDGIIGHDEHGRVSFWNAGAETLTGYAGDEMLGRSVDVIVAPANRHSADAMLERRRGLAGRTVETEIVRKDGRTVPVELSYGSWSQDGTGMFCAILRDIGARKVKDDRLSRLANHDPLTQLPNRNVLITRLGDALAAGLPLAVLMTDLDRFKQVNDLLGHGVGDAVLVIAAERLARCVGENGTVARIGGDEFVLLLTGASDPIAVSAVADAVIASLSEPFCVEDRTLHLSASVGMALSPAHGHRSDELLSCADMALYAAKADGRHGYRLFTPNLRSAAIAENECRQEFRRAVDAGEFVLFYQPQIRLSDGALVGAEALIRWHHPVRGILPPAAFLDVLETSRHAAEVGDWVVRTACRQAAAWRQGDVTGFRMGVNLSGSQFRFPDLADRICGTLAAEGLPGEALEVEITEKIILGHDDALIGPLQQLRAAGVGVAFDDYGTGYASLSLLKRFPLTRLKIDRSFVRDMGASMADAAIIRAVLLLARSLDLQVIAEGIETADQLAWLRHKGCDEGQGYLFGRPMPAAEFEARFALPSPGRRAA